MKTEPENLTTEEKQLFWKKEYSKCKKSPWYYVKNYTTFGPQLKQTEEEFNSVYFKLAGLNKVILKKNRLRK